MIPKRFHYVWVGSDLPDPQQRHIDTWRKTNPDFEMVLWNESNIDFSVPALRQAYDRKLWAKVADITRLMAIHAQGGIYLDVDFQLYRSLVPLLVRNCIFGFQTSARSTDWVANGMIGAQPGHWFIEHALNRLLSMRTMPLGLDRPTKFGPKLITRLLIEQGLTRYHPDGVEVKDIFICPTPWFFPWAFDEEFREACITPASYGIHLWEKSWAKDVPFPIRLGKSLLGRTRRMVASTMPSA